ncbi:MAG: hypothetical protein IPH12_11920 [Saprospirales bacterium]|nr:hypothetical protein [Saprospirales bacterium]
MYNPDGTPCPSAVNWTLNGPNGPVAQGTTVSPVVISLPPALFNLLGSYSLVMSTLCPGQTDTCYCIARWINDCCDICENNLVLNPGFFEGAVGGDLGNPGASNNWTVASGSPQVFMSDGACDPVSMQMWGNLNFGESICQQINFIAGRTYAVEFFAKFFLQNQNLTTPFVNFELSATNGCLEPVSCTIPACEAHWYCEQHYKYRLGKVYPAELAGYQQSYEPGYPCL